MTWWHNFLLNYPLKCGFLLCYFMDLFAEVSTSSKHIITVIDLLLKLQLYHMFFPGHPTACPKSIWHIIQRIYSEYIQTSYPFFSFHPTTVSTLWSMYSICLAVLQPLCLALRSRPPCIPPSNVYIISHQQIEADIPIHTYSSRISLKPLYLCGTSAL